MCVGHALNIRFGSTTIFYHFEVWNLKNFLNLFTLCVVIAQEWRNAFHHLTQLPLRGNFRSSCATNVVWDKHRVWLLVNAVSFRALQQENSVVCCSGTTVNFLSGQKLTAQNWYVWNQFVGNVVSHEIASKGLKKPLCIISIPSTTRPDVGISDSQPFHW